MVYNFNLGIGWASSGVEYAQSYRANLLRRAHIPARFVFTDMFPTENIEHMTRNIGFLDEEVIWLYTFFTDVRTSPVTFTLKELEASMAEEDYTFSRDGKTCRYQFKESGRFYTCYMVDDTSDLVHRVEIVSNGCLIRKDFYTYCRTFSEYYAPLDGKAHLYGRTFFNEDGSVCYEEVIEDDSTFYRIGAQVLYTKADLVGYMVKRLNLTADDVVIIDRTTGIGQAILENCGPARVGIVVHADHFSEGGTDDDYILWNNYYEYSFSQTEHIDFYITATDAQNELMRQQFKKYCGKEPHVVTIPVGSLDELKYPDEPRKRHSLITASRLATEKHCDWLVEAVVKAKESVPDISLDIYVLVIVALLIVLPVVLPPIFGYHTYLSGTDHTGNISKNGSVVYLKTIDEASYKDGNIVAIESADSSGRRVDSYYVDSNDSSAKEIALRDGNGVSYKVVKGQVIAKTPFIGYLSQLCFSAVGIIVTVVIFAAGVAIMMYVNKISKEINTMVEQQTA